MLKPSNYSLWAIRMQIILEANGLWETIDPSETTNSDTKKDKTTIAFLYQALPEEQLLQITKYKSSKDIWEALKTRHLGETRVQQARLKTLKSEFKMLRMKEDETIDAFTSKITTMANKAATLGHTFEDSTLVQKLLNAVPDSVNSITTVTVTCNLVAAFFLVYYAMLFCSFDISDYLLYYLQVMILRVLHESAE
nr:zinc finger, CCHC-type [Tanacetum cinerariifolium]